MKGIEILSSDLVVQLTNRLEENSRLIASLSRENESLKAKRKYLSIRALCERWDKDNQTVWKYLKMYSKQFFPLRGLNFTDKRSFSVREDDIIKLEKMLLTKVEDL